MDTHLFDDVTDVPRDDESQRRIKTEYVRRMLVQYPEAGNDLRRESMVQARLTEARRALRRVLARRGLDVSVESDARIEECDDVDELERWHDQAIVAALTEESLA